MIHLLERAVGHPPFGTVNTVLAKQIVEFVNDLMASDPDAVRSLFESRTACNETIAAHPTVVVGDDEDGEFTLGLLGLLNGLCGVWDEASAPSPGLVCCGAIWGVYDEHGRLLKLQFRDS